MSGLGGTAPQALAITGVGAVAPTGVGHEALRSAMAAVPVAAGAGGAAGAGAQRMGAAAGGSSLDEFSAALSDLGRAVPGFDVRALLGRRGTSFLNRCTALALVACAEAIADSGIGESPSRVGVSLGTSTGSLSSMSDYTRETLVEARPYLVNPALFPNTVMNCASGQAAIRFGLRGINSTIAGGALAFLGVLHVCGRSLRLGHVDAVLAGAVEELSPDRAAQCALLGDGRVLPGEGAAVVVLEPAGHAAAAGRAVDAVLESVTLGFVPGGERAGKVGAGLVARVQRALARAGVEPADVDTVACVVPSDTSAPRVGEDAVAAALGEHSPEWLELEDTIGDCGAAAGALHTAALLARHRDDAERDGRCSLLVGWTAEGAVGAAVLRGYSRDGGSA